MTLKVINFYDDRERLMRVEFHIDNRNYARFFGSSQFNTRGKSYMDTREYYHSIGIPMGFDNPTPDYTYEEMEGEEI